MSRRDFDPLALIPSAEALRRKLAEIIEQARRLRIVLRTAERIERDRSSPNAPRTDRRQEVRDED